MRDVVCMCLMCVCDGICCVGNMICVCVGYGMWCVCDIVCVCVCVYMA